MSRLSESRLKYGLLCLSVFWLGVSAQEQDPLSGVLPSNSQLWKSFQEEMKTLEQAAHNVNRLLSERVSQHVKNSAPDDQETKPSENSPDVTVLTSLGVNEDLPVETKPEEATKNPADSPAQPGGIKQTLKPHFSLGSFMNSFGFFNNLPEPWWKGKNVCVEKSEKMEEKHQDEKEAEKHVLIMGTGTFEHCKQTSGKYICTTVISTPQQTKTLSTTYQCCEGFRRQAEGCVEVELKDPVELLQSVDSKEFASLLTSHDVMGSVADRNVTIFAPVDEAMKSHHVDFQESNQIRQRRAVEELSENPVRADAEQRGLSANDIAMAHMADGLMDIDDFTNEMVLKSLYKETPLRVNIYPGRDDAVMTVNCARLRSWDNYATHARIHTLERVLEPVTQTITDVLSQPQFSQFKQFLEQQGLWEKLENSTAVTVFAPNNEAWDKLGGLKDKYSRGEACIDKVLRHHILPLTLCAAPASEGRLTTADVDGELMRLSRDDDNQLMVDDRGRVVQEDIMATNGVVHVLDKVLTPKSAKPLSDLLASSNHTTFLSLLDRAGLIEDLNKQENITVFVPTERALSNEATVAMLDSLDTEALRRVLLYHISEQAPTCDLKNHAELKTREGNTLRVTMFNLYAMFSGADLRAAVQCVPLGRTDGKACHAVAHEVTRLLLPPNSTILQLINDDPRFSVLRRVIEGTDVEKDLDENTKSELLTEGFTLLAPSDEAFNELDEDVLNKLLTDKKFASEVLRTHLVREPICCASISSMPWPFTNSVRTLEGRKVEVNRDRSNRVLFGTGRAEKCDIIATDGIVHIIDSVLLPKTNKAKLGNVEFGSPDRRIVLFGI